MTRIPKGADLILNKVSGAPARLAGQLRLQLESSARGGTGD
jgi:hypothetical protein